MREIKFRAYSRASGNMIHNPFYQGAGLNDIFSEATNFVYMQYTGLKDNNGIEIYEGDIMRSRNWRTREHYHRTVKYFGGQFIYKPNLGVLYDHIPSGEVVGNIYENPELLEEEK